MLRLDLPPAPPLNNAYANNRRTGGRYKTARYKRWIKQADSYYVLQALHLVPKITVPYQCVMTFPHKMTSDIDGRAKLILDWMVKRELVIDDKFCRRLHLEINPEKDFGDVYIEAEPYDARPFVSDRPLAA